MSKAPPKGEIYAIFGNDGSRFTRFDLTLPKGSIVKRPKDGVLTVENNRLFLQISVNYEGFNSNLPYGFVQNYLGLDMEEIDTRKLDIVINYRIKPAAIFYRSRWNYYNWIDSFADCLIEYASFDDFIKKVNWETNLTGIVASNQRRKILKELGEKNKDKSEK